MKCTVLVDGLKITEEDALELNTGEYSQEVEFSPITSKNFMPPEIVLIMIELGKSTGYSAVYDMLKYILLKVLQLLPKKKPQENVKIEVVCKQDKFSISYNTQLTEEQKEKLIDAAIQKFVNES